MKTTVTVSSNTDKEITLKMDHYEFQLLVELVDLFELDFDAQVQFEALYDEIKQGQGNRVNANTLFRMHKSLIDKQNLVHQLASTLRTLA